MKINPILTTDGYKPTHFLQYDPDITKVHSYFESRLGAKFPYTVFFGLQYILTEYLEGQRITYDDVYQADQFYSEYFGNENYFNKAGWLRLVEKHQGRLPVVIKAVPEGFKVPVSNVMMTVENTDPEFPWITNYIETILTQVWYPSTIATQSHIMRTIINNAIKETSDLHEYTGAYKVHDFGFRGSTSYESAAIGGAAHLTSFLGTDTLPGIELLKQYYSAPEPDYVYGVSIPAAEHSTITSWGKDRETEAYKNMLDKFPTGMVAVVSDSYDLFNAIENIWGGALADQVRSRTGTLVIRPDSGVPEQIVLKVLNKLGDIFGFTLNSKGYKVLPPYIRVIQGDGITLESMAKIISNMKAEWWSIDNVAFGSGGGLLQKVDRDTQRFAFKASSVYYGGTINKWIDVMKSPKTDVLKTSKTGRLWLSMEEDGRIRTKNMETHPINYNINMLSTVFLNGSLVTRHSIDDIRDRVYMHSKYLESGNTEDGFEVRSDGAWLLA